MQRFTSGNQQWNIINVPRKVDRQKRIGHSVFFWSPFGNNLITFWTFLVTFFCLSPLASRLFAATLLGTFTGTLVNVGDLLWWMESLVNMTLWVRQSLPNFARFAKVRIKVRASFVVRAGTSWIQSPPKGAGKLVQRKNRRKVWNILFDTFWRLFLTFLPCAEFTTWRCHGRASACRPGWGGAPNQAATWAKTRKPTSWTQIMDGRRMSAPKWLQFQFLTDYKMIVSVLFA